MYDWSEVAQMHLEESIRVKRSVISQCIPSLLAASELVTHAFRSDRKLLICGNGGSAADAQHLAAEFISTLTTAFDRPALPAFALTGDTSTLTSRANDFGFDEVFSRQVEAFGRPGDVLLAISTSGGSKNCLEAMRAAKGRDMKSIVLSGGTGGKMAEQADVSIVVPSRITAHVQEAHIALYHILCHIVERELNPELTARLASN